MNERTLTCSAGLPAEACLVYSCLISISMKTILAFCLLALFTLSCKKEADVSPADTCKLARLINYTGTNDFTYDAAGNLSKWLITRAFSNGKKYLINYDFTRDATGRISSLNQTITNDGLIQSTATAQFTYTNGLLTSTSTIVDPAKSPTISRTFTYDSNGRMNKRVVSEKTSGFTSTEIYEYDSRGNCTTYTYTDSDGFKNERVFTYDTSKNPEQLLIKSIPFNLSTGLPWSINVVLTTKDTSDFGQGPEPYTSKRTDIKTDVRGYVTGATETYDDGFVVKDMYSLTGCQ